MKPDETEPLARLQACLEDIKHWMTSNFLLLNFGKTEVLFLDPKFGGPDYQTAFSLWMA